jgi:hypothetical protein
MLISYVRNDKGQPIGVVASPGKYLVGVSICNPKDKFDRQLGLEIACGRAMRVENIYPKTLPNRNDLSLDMLDDMVDTMYRRSRKYYKDV